MTETTESERFDDVEQLLQHVRSGDYEISQYNLTAENPLFTEVNVSVRVYHND